MPDDKNVIIEFLDGTNMKAPPETWDGVIAAFNGRYASMTIKTEMVETLVPLAAIKRVYRSL